MSEHTPLTEAEWLDLGVVAAQAIRDNLPSDAFGDPKRLRDYSDIWGAAAKNAIRRHLAARTSTATADTATADGNGRYPMNAEDDAPCISRSDCLAYQHARSCPNYTATADTAYRRLYDRYNDLYAKWLKAAHPWCICEEGPYFGAQQIGTPLRCERCRRDETAATADTGLRERVALTRIVALLDEELEPDLDDYEHRAVRIYHLARTALNATPASTEDRADNEGAR